MKVLDLDMDFFLSGPCPMATLGHRPSEDAAEAWAGDEVRSFLEERCGLSRERPIPGAIFATHDGALRFWQRLVKEGTLGTPFQCVHVDTHSDLAFGPPGPDFVLRAVLSRAPQARDTIDAYTAGKKLDEANYLLFALAFRWIDALTYVRNPKSHEDIPRRLLTETGDIVLRSDMSALMEAIHGPEPQIAFHRVDDWRTFKEDGFAFATLAQSPRYAPQKADFIMGIFREYITEIE